MSDATDIVERLNEGVITNGSGYLYAGVNESATGYLMELAADEIVKLRERKCPCPCHLPGNIGMALCDADWASDE
jgi:hypothetical protein